jgi:hypothetical protein
MDKEKVQKIDEKINQLKAQKQAILAREKEKERKARTRNLIQMGALLEKYLEIHTPEETEKWLQEYTKKSPESY